MSNVISIGLPRRPNLAQRQAALIRNFALHRRQPDDVFWLKENAELLNILATSDATLLPGALDVFASFCRTLPERLNFFPQYYRFLLSICLDLEDLGLPAGPPRRRPDGCGAGCAPAPVHRDTADFRAAEQKSGL